MSSFAQASAAPMIVEKVNENQLVTLRGNTPPAATALNDRGRVSPAMPMSGLVLVLRRSPEQQAAFDAFVASQYDSTSPSFHHWLQPAEIGEKFGPALADIATISTWLGSHGLSVEEVSKDRMTIRFSGSSGQVEETFHTEIHNLLVNGEPHLSNMSDPQIPMALDPVVLGPKALHNFIPRPLHRLGGKATLNQETGKWQRVEKPNLSASGVRPDFGFSTCGGSPCLIEDVAPYDFATIYNVLPLWKASTPIDGTGQKIAIAGRSDVRAADVAAFRSTFGLTGGAFNTIFNAETGTVDPGYCTGTTGNCTLDDQVENALDVEWSGAVAKGATIDLVVTQQTNTNDAIFDSAQYVITHLTAPVLNVSYGQCELFLGTNNNTAYNNLWQSASTAGIAVIVATGDSGSPSCDQGGAANGPYGAQFGLSVSGIASTPYNTAVGGTDFNWGTTAAPYWNATNSTTNGSTAAGYIPEVPWNDTCTNPIIVGIINGELSANLSANQMCYEIAAQQITSSGSEQGLLDLVNSVGGSGGASNCTVNSTTNTTTNPNPGSCSGGYAKPTWQTGVAGIPTDSHRDIPDVSFFAGNGFLGSAYLICASDAGACVASATATAEPSGQEIGGTSVASPAMAGVMALINQKAGSAQGNPNAELYTLAGKQTYSSCTAESVTSGGSCFFNDIDTGTIAMACAAGSPNCTLATTGNTYGELTGFSAGTGYDEATGLGSLNVANVVNGWNASTTGTGTATATVGVVATPSSFTSVQGTSVTVTVTGSSGTPTGNVFLTSGSFGSATKALVSGTVTFSLSPGVLAAGTDTITASYSGDATYAAATGTTQVTITQVKYALAAGAASPSSVSPGGSSTSTITVSTTDGYVGAVTLTCAVTTSPAGASDLPTCVVGGSPVTLSSTTTSATGTVTVSTTAATASMHKPRVGGWAEAGSGAVLALLVFFGIPARRRGWRAMVGAFVLLATLGSLAACGGGSSSTNKNPGTTAGSYTFTVTGTGNPAVTPAPTATFSVTVN